MRELLFTALLPELFSESSGGVLFGSSSGLSFMILSMLPYHLYLRHYWEYLLLFFVRSPKLCRFIYRDTSRQKCGVASRRQGGYSHTLSDEFRGVSYDSRSGDILPELKSADSGDKLPQSPFFDPEFLIFENFTGIIRALSEE